VSPEPSELGGAVEGGTLGEGGVGGTRRIAVVPHTHWDREWYEPFQTFRLKLVHLVDGLLDQLERDASFSHFLLDGQLAVLDDYLEIRPEHEPRLRRLAAAGRLSVGPWYILMDEFLVSGETIIRNLQAGMERGAAFGGVMEVGYLPDMFGHVAQMPQILSEAGFEHAVVWRGVPASVDRTAFRWRAPDGSAVRAEYLVAGYGNGAALPDDAKALVRRLRALAEEFDRFLRPEDALLLMNGTDHQRPQPWLGRVVAEANQIQGDFELTVSSLSEYLQQAADGDLPEWSGELRSGARSNLLMGVGSNRVDVKQAAARAERSLERMAEPLSALFLPAGEWPQPYFALAWRLMVRNAAHDSICACSIDEVVDAVLHRYAEARAIGEGLADEAIGAVARSMGTSGPLALNPSARDRSGQVEVVVTAVGEPGPDVQVLSERIGIPGSITLDGVTVRNMLGFIQGARIDADTYVTDVSLAEDEEGLEVTVVIGTEAREGVAVEEVKRELFTRLTARPDTQVRLTLDQPPVRRILARQRVPGFGWAHFAPDPLSHPVRAVVGQSDPEGAEPADRGVAEGVTLTNGLVTVVVDGRDGTFSVDGIGGYGRLVDGGDHGDTYNYSPPAVDSVVDAPERVSVAIGDRGPVRATATIRSTFAWPDRVDGDSSSRTGRHDVVVTTTLELRADEPIVRVSTEFVNPSRDHRLRVHLPLPEPATTSRAECAFAVVERGLVAEGRDDEYGTPTFPSRRFVSAGGLTVVHEGLLEYELVDIDGDSGGAAVGRGAAVGGGAAARTLALTLLRSTGMLSRLGMTTRPLPAGPTTSIEGPQLLGPVALRYALALGDVDPFAMAEDVLVPLATAASFGGGDRPDRGSVLTVRGGEVSAVRREAGRLEVRVFNPRSHATRVELPGRSGWLVDLRGRAVAAFEGGFELRAHGIATARLDEG
jgi:mannosylglycerate hydrolase